MHIGVDGRFICGKRTGMGNVVVSVLSYWKSTENTKITVFVPEKVERKYSAIFQNNGIDVKVIGNCNYFCWEQILIPRKTKECAIDVLWSPYNTAPFRIPCWTVVTVNDVIYMHSPLGSAPSLYKKAGIIYRRLFVPRAIRRANRVITISEYAKKSIIDCFPFAAKKIDVIYLSVDKNAQPLNRDETQAFFEINEIRKPYILGFGSLEIRKNALGLIKVYESFPEKIKDRYQLVIYGFKNYELSPEYKYLSGKKLKNIKILGYVSEEEKTTLYKNSAMFVFPSLSEGFGIPVLEAFAAGVPVITSNTTSLPEVAGAGAILVNPSSSAEIREAILKLIESPKLCAELVKNQAKQLKKFSWEKTAKRLYREMEMVFLR